MSSEKRNDIFKTKKEYIISTYSLSDIGLYIGDDPIYRLPLDTNLKDLEYYIFDSLSKSRQGIKTPNREEWSDWTRLQLEKMGQKSFTSLYKNSSSCSLELKNSILRICPEAYYDSSKPSQGLINVMDELVEIELTEEVKPKVVQILLDLLNRKFR